MRFLSDIYQRAQEYVMRTRNALRPGNKQPKDDKNPGRTERSFELPWIAEARKHIGVREIPGPAHNQKIVEWWRKILRGGIRDDETPWCAAFVGAVLESCGVKSTRFEGALSYKNWGKQLFKPAYGAIVVMEREGGGHVGFCVGRSVKGEVMVLGGNQNNEVNVRAFPMARIIAWRWPPHCTPPEFKPLAIYTDYIEGTEVA